MKIKTVRKTAGALALCGVLLLASCADENTGQMKTSPPKAEKGLSQKQEKKLIITACLTRCRKAKARILLIFRRLASTVKKSMKAFGAEKSLQW